MRATGRRGAARLGLVSLLVLGHILEIGSIFTAGRHSDSMEDFPLPMRPSGPSAAPRKREGSAGFSRPNSAGESRASWDSARVVKIAETGGDETGADTAVWGARGVSEGRAPGAKEAPGGVAPNLIIPGDGGKGEETPLERASPAGTGALPRVGGSNGGAAGRVESNGGAAGRGERNGGPGTPVVSASNGRKSPLLAPAGRVPPGGTERLQATTNLISHTVLIEWF